MDVGLSTCHKTCQNLSVRLVLQLARKLGAVEKYIKELGVDFGL